jgi:flagellar biosynthesis regulator FlaF
MSPAEMRELLDAAKATAKASRENVDYIRVVPDILFQILAKLDKVENKLDRIENELKAAKASAAKKR